MNISGIIWTPEIVKEWLDIASKVNRALPPVGHRKLRCAWLDIAPDWISLLWDELDEDLRKVEPRFRPTNEQVSQWEFVVLRWFPALNNAMDGHIVWKRSCGFGWARISKEHNIDRHTAMRHYNNAIDELVRKLNLKKIKPNPKITR